MLRDNKQFRERFQRWKNGEQVYDKGRPIDLYEIGKDSISDAIYDQEIQQASRNNYTRWGFDSTEDAYRRISNGQAPKPHLNDVVTEDVQVNRYASGKDDKNWYDQFVEQHPTISMVTSFLPIVGTAMDVYDAYKDPSAKNIGYAALSAATDLVGGRLIAKLGGQAIKQHKRFKKAFDVAKKRIF